MEQQERRFRAVTADMDEVDPFAFDVRDELRKLIESALYGAPVEPLEPIVH
jgi:hypothetical protein